MQVPHIINYAGYRGGGGEPENNLIERINTFKTVNFQPFLLKEDYLTRIAIPINTRYAQFYDLTKEISSDDDLFTLSPGWGIAEYFEVKMPDSITGTFSNYGTSQSAYASVSGATISFSFTGTGLKFKSAVDDRGGIWSFVIDGGSPIVVSTWNASFIARVLQTIVADGGLSSGYHTVVGTFLGDDPAHVPSGGVGTSRGWICANTTLDPTTGAVIDKPMWVIGSPIANYCGNANLINYIYFEYLSTNGSHKDYAFNMKDSAFVGANDWQPNHNTIGTATIFDNLTTDRTLKIDGGSNLINTDRYTLGVRGDSIVLEQIYQSVNPNDDANPLYDIHSIVTWSVSGIDIQFEMTNLKEVTTSSSYLSMFDALKNNFSNILVNGTDLSMPVGTTGGTLVSKVNLSGWDGEISVAKATGTDFEKSLVMGMKMLDVSNAMNIENDLNSQLHYETTSQRIKIYPRVAFSESFTDSFSWNTKFTLGIVPDAYNTLKSYAGL